MQSEKASKDQTTPADVRYEATESVASLCATHHDLLYPDIGRKTIATIGRSDGGVATAAAAEALVLKNMPLSPSMLTKLYAFIETHTQISLTDQATAVLEKHSNNFEKLSAVLEKLAVTEQQKVFLIYLQTKLNKKSRRSSILFEEALQHLENNDELKEYLQEILIKVETSTLVTTKQISPLQSEKTTTTLREEALPLQERVRLSTNLKKETLFEATLKANEHITILPNQPDKVPIEIRGAGTTSLVVDFDAMVCLHSPESSRIIKLGKHTSASEVLSDTGHHTQQDALLQFCYDALWKWHTYEFVAVESTLITTLVAALSGIESRKNTGFHKDSVRTVLTDLESRGFPRRKSIEIMDRIDGFCGRSWQLDPSLFTYLEENKQATPEEWRALLKASTDKVTLAAHIEQLATEPEETTQTKLRLTKLEKEVFLESSKESIPAHNIENMVRLFSSFFTAVPALEKKMLHFCYNQATKFPSEQPSLTTFITQLSELIQESRGTTTSETDTIKGQELTRDILASQEMMLRWLYGKVTKNFTQLARTHIKKITQLPATDEVLVNGRPTPRLRYDLSQKALIIKASLAETLPPQLHRYLQLHSQQGNFSREYILAIGDTPELKELNSLLLASVSKKDQQNSYLPARKVQQALFLFAVTNEKLKKETPQLIEIIQKVADALAEKIKNDTKSDVLQYIRTQLRKTPAFQQMAVLRPESDIFDDTEKSSQLLYESLTTIPTQKTQVDARFHALLSTLFWNTSTKISQTKRDEKGKQVNQPFTEFTVQKLLTNLFATPQVTVEGFHGWGANDETIVPFVSELTKEMGEPTLVIANNYMGASKTNTMELTNVEQPISVGGLGQDLTDYGSQLALVLSELDGVAHDSGDIVAGHSMGGHVALQAALHHGSEWRGTSFLALEPVISSANKTITDPSTGKKINHYISLLGASKGETRQFSKKAAAIITELITNPESPLPDTIQDLLVFLGRIKVNSAVYSQLVEQSNLRAALSHYAELIYNRSTFHTHVTPILQEIRALTPEERCTWQTS